MFRGSVTVFVFLLSLLHGHHHGAEGQPGRTKYILLYTSLARPLPNWHLGKENVGGQAYFERIKCPFTNCVVTSNKTYLNNLSDYDMIGFNSWNVHSLEDFPPPETRRPEQIYFLYYHESPTRTKEPLKEYSQFFNWTMSFRLDADVIVPYFRILDLHTEEVVAPALKPAWRIPNFQTPIVRDPTVISLVERKTKMASWFVSSCFSPSQRKFVVMKLQEFMPVDIYGKCGPLDCDKKDRTGCREMVERDYKFYLSFENSLCTDYVTEKVFEMMNYYVIPVVFGGADYTRFLPPRSYVNVMDFETVQDLAAYLHYLANDIDEYMRYFWWKDYYTPVSSLNFCPLCQKAMEMPEEPTVTKYYNDVDFWFKNGTCLDPADVPLVREVLIQNKRLRI